jgi:hypothetical protein
LGRPVRPGAIPKLVERVSHALLPHSMAMGEVARTAPVPSMDETSWLLHGARPWLWGMAHPAVASCQIHPARSQAACVQRRGAWRGPASVTGSGALTPGKASGSVAWHL